MKKILIVAVLMVLVAGSAFALDINSAAPPMFVPSGFVSWADTVAITAPQPSGFLMFNGDGSEFWVEFKYSGTIQTGATSVPGNLILPAPTAVKDGDTYIYSAFINCPTDSVAIYRVYR